MAKEETPRPADAVRRVAASAPRPRTPVIANVAAGISPDAHKPAAKTARPVADAFEYDVAFRVALVGAGQGGGRIANAFHTLGYRRVAAFNTTEADFNGLHAGVHKLSLDVGGAGKDAELARQALSGREEDVRDLLATAWGTDPDCALVCASLGGGTGSGTAPELVKIARRYMEDRGLPPRVGAVVSLPPAAEGFQICRNAVAGFQALTEMKVSPLVVIDNAKINELYRPAMSQLHGTANDTVARLFHLFNQLAAVHSRYITFDRAELGQLLDSGMVVMGASDIQTLDSPTDVSKAIRDHMGDNVLAQVDLKTGRKAACLFVGSEEVLGRLGLDYFDAGFTQLDRIMGDGKGDTVVHRGLYEGEEPGLQAYVMVGGLDVPRQRLAELARKGGLLGGSQSAGRSRVAEFLGVQDGSET